MARASTTVVAAVVILSVGLAVGYIARSVLDSGPEVQVDGSQSMGEAPLAFSDCADCPEMVRIPGQSFAAGRYEVTLGQWKLFVQDTGRHDQPVQFASWSCDWRTPGFTQDDTHPVTCVSWKDAQAYAQWLSQRTGEHYRLMTSAEWRIAARAETNTKYSWGNQDPVCDQSARTRNGANFSLCADDRTRPVGSFKPNGYGLYDVHGNVSEWVEDCRPEGIVFGHCGNGSYCGATGRIEAALFDHRCGEASYRAELGGSWDQDPEYLQTAKRIGVYWHPGLRDEIIGFRVARSL